MTETRSSYPYLHPVTTRWMDNDVYGHVNNVVYYSFFDTAVNELLVRRGVLDLEKSPAIGLVIETQCRYHAPITFPDRVEVGVRVSRLGNSSVRYELAIFREDDPTPAATGHFVHVYVDRGTRRPMTIPDPVREVLSGLLREPDRP